MARRRNGFAQSAETQCATLIDKLMARLAPSRAELDAQVAKLSPTAQARVRGYFAERLDELTDGSARDPGPVIAAPIVVTTGVAGTTTEPPCVCSRPYEAHDAATGKLLDPPGENTTPCESYLPRRT